jgi:hypothetical protein
MLDTCYGKCYTAIIHVTPSAALLRCALRLPRSLLWPELSTTQGRLVEEASAPLPSEPVPTDQTNCLADIIKESSGTEAAFELLPGCRRDAISNGPIGPNCERYRLRRGRLGVGDDMASLAAARNTTTRENGIQKSCRRATASQARALAWAGVVMGALDRQDHAQRGARGQCADHSTTCRVPPAETKPKVLAKERHDTDQIWHTDGPASPTAPSRVIHPFSSRWLPATAAGLASGRWTRCGPSLRPCAASLAARSYPWDPPGSACFIRSPTACSSSARPCRY